MSFPILIDKESSLPVYLQIARAIREKIVSGQLPEACRLPSTSSLSAELGLSRSTVVKAYEDLAAQGFLEAKAGGATYVSKRLRNHQSAKSTEAIENPSDSVKISQYGQNLLSIKSKGASSVENEKLNYGGPASNFLPIKTWKKILVKESQSLQLSSEYLHPEALGLFACREAIAAYLQRTKGIDCTSEQIMIFSGCKEPLMLAAKLLLNTNDLAAVEDPCYEDVLSYLHIAGARTTDIQVDDQGLLTEELFDKVPDCRFLYLSPLQDPSGVILSMERRKAIASWAAENKTIIFEESWDTDFNYAGLALPSLQSLCREQVIYSYSFWKLLYPLVSLGVLVLPPSLLAVFQKSRELGDIQFSMLEQSALASYIAEGHLERHLRKLKPVYEKLRSGAMNCLLENLAGRIKFAKQSAGLHLCFRLAKEFSEQDISLNSKSTGLPLISTSPYYRAAPPANEYILPFTLLARSELEKRIRLFAESLKKASESAQKSND